MNLKYEKQLNKKGYNIVVGLDEAGRGSWAGPIVAGCVYIPLDFVFSKTDKLLIQQIKDSKKLNPDKRKELYDFITKNFIYAVGVVGSSVIDKIGIGSANKLALKKAVKNLSNSYSSLKFQQMRKYRIDPDYILVDYFNDIGIDDIPVKGIKFGDNKVFSIAAASIVAKVYRDMLMIRMSKKYPQYSFDKHKGYGTRLHMELLVKYGPCMFHRKSYKPICELTKK